MKRCNCRACRARDHERFARIVAHGFTDTERTRLTYASILGPVPRWHGAHLTECPAGPPMVSGRPTTDHGRPADRRPRPGPGGREHA